MRPLEHRTQAPDYIIRPFKAGDRETIRRICCETGFLGEPIDAVFNDRDVFADYLTRYYTDAEPETSWVGEKDGRVVGYLLGCKRWDFHKRWCFWNNLRVAAKVAWRFVRGRYDAKSRKFLAWILLKAWREAPFTPPVAAHFHFNSVKEHRKMGIARDLVMTLLADLRKNRVRHVYGQMVTYDTRRNERLYEYMGWKMVDRRRISKYEGQVDKEMYLTTLMKDLADPDRPLQDKPPREQPGTPPNLD